MDVVRFGRALGFGARQAVKTVTAAVDAASAENPSRKRTGTGASAAPTNAPPAPPSPSQQRGAADSTPASAPTALQKATGKAAHRAAQTVVQARGARQRLRSGGRGFRESTWRTFKRLGGVLWLEVSGVFFGVFALFAMGAVWHLRGEWHSNAAEHRRLGIAVAMFAIFGYFCVSNFVRAHRRERQR